MQFNLRGRTGSWLLSALLIFGVLGACADPAQATAKKKHPKGFVHDTAGDGAAPPPPITSYTKGGTPKWIQYDWGGLYYYNKNEPGKARQYWMESLREAEAVVPAERAKGLKDETAKACCQLITHLAFFVDSSKYKKKYDANYFGSAIDSAHSSSSATANPVQYQLDNVKANLRDMYSDWDWYERICNFANRAIGKRRDCMRQIYNQRAVFERKIVMTRQTGLALEKQMGIEPRNTSIDLRPLKWDGVEGAGNPFDAPGSNPTPIPLRGGAFPENLPQGALGGSH